MAVTTTFKNGSYVENREGTHVELQCSTRNEIQTIGTQGYLPGSECFCTEDGSVWVLGYSGSALSWIEVVV